MLTLDTVHSHNIYKYIYIKILIPDFNPFTKSFQLHNFTHFSNKVLLSHQNQKKVLSLERNLTYSEFLDKSRDVHLPKLANFVYICYTREKKYPVVFTRKQLYKIFANFDRSYLLHFPTFYNQTLY